MNGDRTCATSMTGSVRYLNAVLTVIALLLMVQFVQSLSITPPSEALAERPPSQDQVPAPPNAAEQRERMIKAINALDARLAKIETAVSKKAFDVKVLEMPPLQPTEQ